MALTVVAWGERSTSRAAGVMSGSAAPRAAGRTERRTRPSIVEAEGDAREAEPRGNDFNSYRHPDRLLGRTSGANVSNGSGK